MKLNTKIIIVTLFIAGLMSLGACSSGSSSGSNNASLKGTVSIKAKSNQ
ncbi:MAG: hypothetical protein OEY11_06060 [Gammaproteobacteria bacterium]|nr:hypothetical protein [Gammaproteobacteria bacterium]